MTLIELLLFISNLLGPFRTTTTLYYLGIIVGVVQTCSKSNGLQFPIYLRLALVDYETYNKGSLVPHRIIHLGIPSLSSNAGTFNNCIYLSNRFMAWVSWAPPLPLIVSRIFPKIVSPTGVILKGLSGLRYWTCLGRRAFPCGIVFLIILPRMQGNIFAISYVVTIWVVIRAVERCFIPIF